MHFHLACYYAKGSDVTTSLVGLVYTMTLTLLIHHLSRTQFEEQYRDTNPLRLLVEITLRLSKDDLLHICMTSRAFRDQAMHLLFHIVELHHSRSKQIYAWCQLTNSRVHLAQTVKYLSLPLILENNLEDLEHDLRFDQPRNVLYPALKALSISNHLQSWR